MRPSILNPLFSDVIKLSGVGSRIREFLKNLLKTKSDGDIREYNPVAKDLLFLFPYGFVDRRSMPDLCMAQDGTVITAIVEVEEYLLPPRATNRPLKIICKNETGYLTIAFFNPNERYVSSQLPLHEKRIVSGRVEKFDGMLQMVHPDYIAPLADLEKICRAEPIYPLTHGITQRFLNKIMGEVLSLTPDLEEWIDDELLKKHKWKSWKESVVELHNPSSEEDVQPSSPAKMRLAYDELLANQLALGLIRKRVRKQNGNIIKGDGVLRDKVLKTLPFSLTDGQKEVLCEILSDMCGNKRMVRLLQGDVGSGKTVVALLAMINAVECGKQAALMAPTEILSRQHMEWISNAIKSAGLENKINIKLLTGRDKGNSRKNILEELKAGEIDIIIGTHALFQKDVHFNSLALVVIDEQHRFGVKQRMTLSSKGRNTDILLMSATPIPRTLTLTLYGDMEISNLKEKPSGRIIVDTRIMSDARIDGITNRLKSAIADKNRIFWVCPLIEESKDLSDDNKKPAAEKRFSYLKQIFGNKVGLVHGKMSAEEKDSVMLAFKAGELDILVATTVIEVGVDVPEATIMIIEHAESFGLSQLHQLRGRVGRHKRKSSCILLYGSDVGESGIKRLKVLRETDDGFRIAEEDLIMRGGGDILGTKQSGMPEFRIAVFPEHSELLFAARDDVRTILNRDPKLESTRGKNIKTLMHLFGYKLNKP